MCCETVIAGIFHPWLGQRSCFLDKLMFPIKHLQISSVAKQETPNPRRFKSTHLRCWNDLFYFYLLTWLMDYRRATKGKLRSVKGHSNLLQPAPIWVCLPSYSWIISLSLHSLVMSFFLLCFLSLRFSVRLVPPELVLMSALPGACHIRRGNNPWNDCSLFLTLLLSIPVSPLFLILFLAQCHSTLHLAAGPRTSRKWRLLSMCIHTLTRIRQWIFWRGWANVYVLYSLTRARLSKQGECAIPLNPH